jgi:uncharacterized LabA/DUF88 family protein
MMSEYKVALLVDGAWFSKAVGLQLKPPLEWPTAVQIYSNLVRITEQDESLIKILYYESEPFQGVLENPISRETIDYSLSRGYSSRNRFLRELAQKEYIALRQGEIMCHGWNLTAEYQKRLMSGSLVQITAEDFIPNFQQKGVDMRIGIDAAVISIKRQVDRIILCTGDTDIIPAMKLARREGVQVMIVKVGKWKLHSSLIEHSDRMRTLIPQ